MELDGDGRGELDLGARMVNAARMAVAAHLFESVRERIRLREHEVIDATNAENRDGLSHDPRRDDDIDKDHSLWQRPRTGGAGFRPAGIRDDDGQPALASARRATTLVTDDDEGGQVVAAAKAPAIAIAGGAFASARPPLPTVTARSPRTPRLPADGGAPPHAGGALPRPGLIGIGCGCAADRVRPPCRGGAGAIAWAEGAD
jgi:hypothetical protein